MRRVFLEYGTPLTSVSSFRYLGKMLWSTENDWLEVELNLRRARRKWGRLEDILRREGADKRIIGKFYVAVVQVVLLFGYKTWVLTPRLDKALKGFHHRETQRMVDMGPKSHPDETWV